MKRWRDALFDGLDGSDGFDDSKSWHRIFLYAAAMWMLAASAAHAATIDLDYVGNTVGAGPHDAFQGEMDVSDSNLLAGRFGPEGTSVRSGFNNESSSEASQAMYDALQFSDDIWLQTADPGWGDNAFVQFVLETGLSAADLGLVESVFFEVEARQGNTYFDDWHIFLWDYAQDAYLRLSFFGFKSPDEIKSEMLVGGYTSSNGLTLANAGDLIDPLTGQITGIAVNQDTSDWIRVDTTSVSISVVPEPSTAFLLGMGLFAMSAVARRQH